MNTELLGRTKVISRSRSRRVSSRSSAAASYRSGTSADAPALHSLITRHLEEGHLLRRERDELVGHASRFVVAVRRGRVVGCAELAPLSGRVAEVRSLAVDRSSRALGIGRALVAELERRARGDGFETLCAFTHDAGYFVRLGFSIVPHTWVPEKIAVDCHSCPLFRRCGQHAVVFPLGTAHGPQNRSLVPGATPRG